MSLWSMNDGSALTATDVTFTKSSATVASASTGWGTPDEVTPGDIITSAGGESHRVKSVESDTSLTLTEVFVGSTESGVAATVRRPPLNGQPDQIDTTVFGMDTTEHGAGGDNVVSIAMATGGTGYNTAAPTVTVAGAATATITSPLESSAYEGSITSYTITDVGSGYSAAPAVTVAAPTAHTFNAASDVDDSAETITLTGHTWVTGDQAAYSDGGGTDIQIAEHTDADGNVTAAGDLPATVYIIVVDGNTIKVAPTNNAAEAGDNFALEDGPSENHTLIGVTATATASLGVGASPGFHAGWVKRTVGTGGRAGRLHYETLVAASSISGDDSDDLVLPDS